jgi:uncharacterized protein YkwD
MLQAYCEHSKPPETTRSSSRSCLVTPVAGAEARGMRRAAALLIAGLALSAGASSAHAESARASRVVESEVNDVRAEHGCGPLRMHAGLARAARRQARLLLAEGRLDHNAGTPFAQRLQNAAPEAHMLGEDLAYGTGRAALPSAIVQSWMNSPPHRTVLLDCGFTDIGVGIATGTFGSRGYGTVYAADFAAF